MPKEVFTKESVAVLAQLLTSMKETAEKLDRAISAKENEKVAQARKELLALQKEVEKHL